ncbi:C40 family peptidase [Nocardia sp. NPDC058658]|uniref:C40 family peptidase n=1 Tax=Nocardia sp. NPDC058658 TaxID=3346580 RepID=UPI003654ABDE
MFAFGAPIGVLLLVLLVVVAIDTPARTCAAGYSTGVTGDIGTTVAGLSQSQLRLARDGVVIGMQRGMPQSVIVAELAAQATESSFRNLANSAVPASLGYANDGVGTNYDSVGPHQIRVSMHGEVGVATLMDPIYQINWFYDRAETIDGFESMAPAELAQAIERSEPNAYAAQLDLALRLFHEFETTEPGSGTGTAGCGSTGSGQPLTAADASGFGQAVIAAAERWIGTDYVWGGGDVNGPTGGGFDCSGLTLYAIYQASGGAIRLPHYTQAQQDDPHAIPVAFADRAPGDLIYFTAADDRDSHHVGVFYGRDEQGRDQLLHAPQTGDTVKVSFLSGWDGETMSVRRFEVSAVSDPSQGARL